MLIGYARTSTLEQTAGLEAQRESLRAVGCERVWEEQTSSIGLRESLTGAMTFCRDRDTLVVTKLDRLARSVRHLGEIIEELEGKNVGLRILDLGPRANFFFLPRSKVVFLDSASLAPARLACLLVGTVRACSLSTVLVSQATTA